MHQICNKFGVLQGSEVGRGSISIRVLGPIEYYFGPIGRLNIPNMEVTWALFRPIQTFMPKIMLYKRRGVCSAYATNAWSEPECDE